MSELLERTQHHNDAREFHGLPLREPHASSASSHLFHGRSDVEKNVAAAA
jgi:hypothetical protein